MKNTIIIVFMILILPAYLSAQTATGPQNVTIRSTQISATVLKVDQFNFPKTRLKLKVTESSDCRVLDASKKAIEITADNYIQLENSKINCKDKQNIGAVAAFYLLQGDAIRARIFPGSSQANRWYIYDISRQLSPERAVPGRSATRMFGNLRLALDTDREEYSPGETVTMTLTVSNIGSSTERLSFRSGQRYEFTITRDGEEVWRWSAGKMFTQMFGALPISSGNTVTYKASWDQKDNQSKQVSAGNYEVEAVLTTSQKPQPTVGPVKFKIKRT